MAKKVYAIKEGFDPNSKIKIENRIVDTWAECLKYVKGVKGAKYKSFEDINEAKEYLKGEGDVLRKEDRSYPMDCPHIYVDGSYNIDTEEYAYGLVYIIEDVVHYIESGVGKSDSAKNIRQIAGELKAAIRGVEYALEQGKKKVVIFHDYIGICYHATGFWDRKEESSKEYYAKMQALMAKGIEVIFVKVDSHTGDLYNELADEKCKEKLGISSDKVVAKHLKNNKLYVINELMKEEISTLAPQSVINIININNKEENNDIKQIPEEHGEVFEEKDITWREMKTIFNKLSDVNKKKIYDLAKEFVK